MSATAPDSGLQMEPMTEKQALSTRTPLETAGAISRWLCQGSTQAPSGAYCGWRRPGSSELSPPYPEITGYTLGYLSQTPLDAAGAARAAAGCVWLAARTEAGDFSARPEKTGQAVYTFDLAMVAHGLIRYGLTAGDDRAVAAGLRNADTLVTAAKEHGSLPCVVPGKEPLGQTWSTTGHAHLLKCVQGLLSAASLGRTSARTLAERLIADTLARQEHAFGALVEGCRSGDRTSLHALCYAAEGLWVWGTHENESAPLSLSRRITDWVWRQRLPEDGFPGFVPVCGRSTADAVQQTDVLAQAIRLAALHNLPVPRLKETVGVLLDSVHWLGDDTAAVCYRPQADELHLNCWASLFAVQALRLYAGGRPTLQWFELV